MGIRKSVSDSKLGIAWRNLKRLWVENRAIIIIDFILMFVLALLGVGFISSYIGKGRREIYDVTFGTCVGYGFNHIFLTLLATLFLFYLSLRFLAKFNQDSNYDEVRGYNEAARKEMGSATRMKDGPEKEKTFCSSHAFESTDIILGRDIDHPDQLLSMNPKQYGQNMNVLIVGYPGGGKTRSHVVPTLFQLIRKGESCICTDSKASIYGTVAHVAKLHGYKTCFINFDPKTIAHSDSVNLFTVATKNDVACLNFCEAVVANISGSAPNKSGEDYWAKAEKNLLSAVMLLIKQDKNCPHTLGEVARKLNNSTVDALVAEFNIAKTSSGEGSQLAACANNWINTSEKARADALSGLAMDFTKLINPVIDKVTGTEGVDLALPGKEKCMYFVNLSDTDRSLDFLTALFFEEIINELKDQADNNESQVLDIPTTILFEEFANIGKIPSWEKKMSTLRSRLIKPIMILQSLEQLAQVYGEQEGQIISNACAIQVLLGTNSEPTASYYSKRSGVTEIITQSARADNATTPSDQLKLITSEHAMIAHKERYVYNLDEIYRLQHPKELVFISQRNVCEMERLDMSAHPMMKEVIQIRALYHMPKWVEDLDEAEWDDYEIRAEMEAGHFKSDEEMVIEKCIEMYGTDDVQFYQCTDEDFETFYNGTKVVVDQTDAAEKSIIAETEALNRARKKYGKNATLNEINEKGISDIFK